MTLAVVFFCTTLISAQKAMPVLGTVARSASAHWPAIFSTWNQNSSQSQNPQSQNSQSQNSQSQSSSQSTDHPPAATPATPSSSSTAKRPSGTKRTSAQRLAHKKKAEDCPPAPESSGSPATGSAATGSAATGSAAAGSRAAGSDKAPTDAARTGAASTPAKCPPEKIVVTQGGTKEPSIQLVGGETGDAASRERNATDQNLGSAESNLKEIAGRPLNANQQELVTKVRQFIDQSRSAVQAGELERAGTLALKAKELSDELVKPESQ